MKNLLYQDQLLEIYNSENKKLIDKVTIQNNSTNIIKLDKYNFNSTDLPLFACRNMADSVWFAISKDKKMLSLEHTHPPASFVVHGQRFGSKRN